MMKIAVVLDEVLMNISSKRQAEKHMAFPVTTS